MKVYEVNADDGEKPVTFATKRAAMTEARRAQREYCPRNGTVTVEVIELTRIDKALIVRLINGEGGYAIGHTVIATLKSKRTRDA